MRPRLSQRAAGKQAGPEIVQVKRRRPVASAPPEGSQPSGRPGPALCGHRPCSGAAGWRESPVRRGRLASGWRGAWGTRGKAGVSPHRPPGQSRLAHPPAVCGVSCEPPGRPPLRGPAGDFWAISGPRGGGPAKTLKWGAGGRGSERGGRGRAAYRGREPAFKRVCCSSGDSGGAGDASRSCGADAALSGL